MALGLRNYWDGYFAGRAAPLGMISAEVVHAVFYNFADGEVARHIPRVWETATPEAALVAAGIGGTEAHVLHALSESIPAEKFGRVHHLAADRLARVVEGMRGRGLTDASGWLSDAGRKTKERIESVTDDLGAPAYSSLEPRELDQLTAELEPISATLAAVGSR